MNGQKRMGWGLRAAGITMVVLVAVLCATPSRADWRSGPGFRFDAGLGWSTMRDSMYSDARWDSGALVNVEEYWDLNVRGNGGPTFGAAFFYQFNPFISIELEGRGLFTNPAMATDYTVYWDWDDGRSNWNAYRGFRYDNPRMRTMVGSLNMVTHLTDNGPMRPFFSFGFSAFDTTIRGAYDTAYAYTYTSGDYQYLDFEYPVIDFGADTSTVGFNAGAGGDFQFNRRMAFTFMVKYYYSERKDVLLRVPGGYPELQTLVMRVDPSFWIATGGIKFTF